MFISASILLARSWKEPKYPSIEEWVLKMWYVYTMEYYSAIKDNEFKKFCRQMDRTRAYHAERGNPDTNAHPCNELTNKWTLTQMLTIHMIHPTEHMECRRKIGAGGVSVLH